MGRQAQGRREPAAALVRRAWLRLWLVLGAALVLGGGVAVAGAPAALVLGATGAGLAAVGVVAAMARGEVTAGLVEPLELLAESAGRMAGGEFDAPVARQGTAEVLHIAGELVTLSRTLAVDRRARVQEAGQVERRASTVRQLLKLTQGVGGSLQIERVLEETAKAALTIGGHAYAVMWCPSDADGRLAPAWDTRHPGVLIQAEIQSPGLATVARAASLGQIVTVHDQGAGDRLAVPIVLGLTTLGVIELVTDGDVLAGRDDDLDALEVLAGFAATAIKASRLHAEMERRSETDVLTRVFNRRRLDSDLRFEMARALRYQRPLALIMVDLDHFKSINDAFGHQQGDEVLKLVGDALLRAIRSTDGAYRFGGEEFAVLLRDTSGGAGGMVADRYRLLISENIARLGLPWAVTVSMGVAAVGPGVQTMERLVEEADTALYEAKRAGRNRVVVATPAAHGSLPQGPPRGS